MIDKLRKVRVKFFKFLTSIQVSVRYHYFISYTAIQNINFGVGYGNHEIITNFRLNSMQSIIEAQNFLETLRSDVSQVVILSYRFLNFRVQFFKPESNQQGGSNNVVSLRDYIPRRPKDV